MTRISRRDRRGPGRATTRGIALVAILLLLIVAGGGVLIGTVGSSPRARIDSEARQVRVLAIAKQALIAYAIDITSPTSSRRPGSLICPDVNNDGETGIVPPDISGTSCGSELGWLPYATLGLPELRDASGARLWYAVSQNYRSNADVIRNSETAGAITVDGAGDVVAVIIAPGEALAGQVRPATGFDATSATQRASFLEGANASSDLQTFTRGGTAPFNDQVMVITRAELMRAVEKRVLGEVAIALRAYSASWGGTAAVFPWMKPFEDPRSAADFHGIAGQTSGLLPMHDPTGGNETFASPWSVTWSGISKPPDSAVGTVTPADLQSGPVGGLSMPAAGSTCTWFAGAPGHASCSGSADISLGLVTFLGFPVITSVRTYTFTNLGVAATDPSSPSSVSAPTATEVRTRAVGIVPGTGTFDPGGVIDVRDVITVNVPMVGPLPILAGAGTLTLDGSATGTMTIAGVRYWLDPTSELPAWFTANQWHHVVYAAASPAYLGGGGGDCSASSNCLSLVAFGGAAASSQVGLAVLGAGSVVTALGQNRASASSPSLADYLEQENAAAGTTVARRGYDLGAAAGFNDQARILLRGDLL